MAKSMLYFILGSQKSAQSGHVNSTVCLESERSRGGLRHPKWLLADNARRSVKG